MEVLLFFRLGYYLVKLKQIEISCQAEVDMRLCEHQEI
jgi:hypothetical protein